jgi:hypothetical protein
MGEEGNSLSVTKISKMVKYIHRELSLLDQDQGKLLDGIVEFGPLDGSVIPFIK